MRVFANHRVFHVNECFASLYLLAVHELAHGIYRSDRDTPLLTLFVEFFFRIAATKFRDRCHHDIRMFAPIRHLLEFRAGNRSRTSHPIHQPAPLLDRNDKDARVAVLGRVRVVEVRLFTLARSARGLGAGVAVVRNKIAGDMSRTFVHRDNDVLASGAFQTMIERDRDPKGPIGRRHAVGDLAWRL